MGDQFKTYPLRFVGYGFGLAEAIRGPVGPPWPKLLHTIATGFVFAHTLYKPYQISQTKHASAKRMVTSAADTFIYELIASGILPVFTVVIVKTTVSKVLCPKSCPGSLRLWGPTLAGTAMLPLCIPFTDNLVDYFMDKTIRTLY